MWDERYAQEGFAYGKEPNAFIKQELLKLKSGKILFPAEGEGRNAVYAASLGWVVSAFDISIEGKKKALQLAMEFGVDIDYYVNEGLTLPYRENEFDVIALSYTHFPGHIKADMIRRIIPFLKSGGVVLMEAFSTSHLEYNAKDPHVGGPKDITMLFGLEEIKELFCDFTFSYLSEEEVNLREGIYHNGIGMVIRMCAIKK